MNLTIVEFKGFISVSIEAIFLYMNLTIVEFKDVCYRDERT